MNSQYFWAQDDIKKSPQPAYYEKTQNKNLVGDFFVHQQMKDQQEYDYRTNREGKLNALEDNLKVVEIFKGVCMFNSGEGLIIKFKR